MTILQEILNWSRDHLSAWQQDAVARLYDDRVLQPADLDDIFALAKSEHGIPDALNRKPRSLQGAQSLKAPTADRLVQLQGIRDLANVNALAEGIKLPISPNGLTVIYGENGAGKSGYSRVLKRACRARDRREVILPDARKEPKAAGVPSAVFEALVDGRAVDLYWSTDKEAPEELSDISIFDSHCARAYIDNQGDFAYVPYGLDILAGLVAVCNAVRERASAERTANAPNIAALANLAPPNTEVGRLLLDLSAATKNEDIEKLASLSSADVERLGALSRALSEADPAKKSHILRLRADRFTALSKQIADASSALSDERLASLRRLIDASSSAKRVADLAAEAFRGEPGLLPGTGEEEWKVLIEAARTFTALSHRDHQYPRLDPDSACPLCQNPLGEDGVARLERFDAFINQAAEKSAGEARRLAVNAYRQFESNIPRANYDEMLRLEIQQENAKLASDIAEFLAAVARRHSDTLAACGAKIDWSSITPLPGGISEALVSAAQSINAELKSLLLAVDEKARSALEAERQELASRQQLNKVREVVLEVVAKLKIARKLQACIDSTSTVAISRKSTELSKTMATQEVAEALNAELRSLNVHELHIVMKPESPGGRTQYKLALQLPGGRAPTAVLSEGEQRAIAIATFLAEVRLGRGRGGIVFDDPVSSLDHRRRWEVAQRLAIEATNRQVIVFTTSPRI
jgi:energy-coupling factor transporter ATP-binding protein EcfA2